MDSLFSSFLLPATLAIITLGMGLSLSEKDFRNIFVHPRAVITGLTSQLLLLPLIAFLIAGLTNLDPVYKVGLVVIAACPGGATSNLITYLLRGNVALSISMTALNSIITLVSIPIIVHLSISHFMQEDTAVRLKIGETILKVFSFTVLPTFAGLQIRKRWPGFAESLQAPLRYVLPLLLMLVYAGVMFIDQGTGQAGGRVFLSILPSAFLLNLFGMMGGFLIARILRLRVINQFTIAIEVGLQNSALAIFVAATLLGSNEIALVPVAYGSFSFFTTLAFGWGVKRLGWVPPFTGKDR